MTDQSKFNTVATKYWGRLDDGRVECRMCPRFCKLREDQRGMCFVRANRKGEIVLTTWGRSSGFAIDPIEKKPLNHFFPGTSVLSFGTAGCNLACKFCQNWDISKSREMDRLMDSASPEMIADAASHYQCQSVAFTYNDPVIFHEYAIDVAKACRHKGIRTVAVTAGYVCPSPREEFYRCMDAVNVDLKAFSQRFYKEITGSDLAVVLDTLEYIKNETDVWLEITTLLIPGENDGTAEIDQLTRWIASHLGLRVPLHFSAFHPDWKMLNKDRTPASTLLRAAEIAKANGLCYVYVGNVHHKGASSTYCSNCGAMLIGRDWYELSEWNLDADGRCGDCGTRCDGYFENAPGDWGRRRYAVDVSAFASKRP